MATSQKTFCFLAGQLALMLVMTIPAKDVFALNLLTVKAPIHYECQTTLSGGLWHYEKTGEWKSGKVLPNHQKYPMVLERFDTTQGRRKKDCVEEERRTGGYKTKDRDFCLTFIFPMREAGQFMERTSYCMITSNSYLGENHAIECQLGRLFFDSDRLYGIKADDVSIASLGMMRAYPISVDKFSCVRLDR